jgi:cysteine desulfuration protein SufE
MSIKENQEEIIEEFAILEGDMEMTNFYVMELGQKMPVFNEADKTEDNIVKGCQSKVWLTAELEGDKINFKADSNTAITKGLVSLLVRIFSGQKVNDILQEEVFFPGRIGMDRFIGTQRSNGFGSMIKQIKLYALAYKSKIEI